MSAAVLEQIAKEIATCTNCSLCKNRTKTVPGEGSAVARLLFIGEAPGYHEDQQGRPFVGASGQLLDRLLKAIKTPRQEVFIANVVKCRPPNNMDPTPEQIAACKPYLDRQIAAINPGLIVTLGRFSMARYWPGDRISQIHGKAKISGGRVHLPMFHPAAALRDDRTMAFFKEDGLTIPALLEKAEEVARTELWGLANGEEDTSSAQPILATQAPPAPSNGTTRRVLKEEPAPPPLTAPANVVPEGEVGAGVELVEIATDNAPVLEDALLVAPDLVAATPAPKAARARKPKVEKLIETEVVASATRKNPAPAKIRKKREPALGEQLTMF